MALLFYCTILLCSTSKGTIFILFSGDPWLKNPECGLMDRCLPHGKMKKINVVEVWFMIFSNCVSFPGVAMLKLGGSSSRRQRNSAWQSCCHIMTGTAKKQFLILSWLHARLEQICPQVSFACNIGTFGFVALCLSTFGFQCDSVLLTFGIH